MQTQRVPTFQSVIQALQEFWAAQGCVLWQPYYTQVGAGTMNPATFLRVLGPEPWRVAYVEPSIRPDDGRYGENPNRLQQHYQFQIILKPDPGNPQDLYLCSLLAIGLDPRRHDIRFVEDNWESPALGAWGLGWEVWLDGQEITQFTYFQQAGGQILRPNSVELTYGLERILISLQQVDSFTQIRWNEDTTYGDLNLQGEREHSAYYFEKADVQRLWTMFSEFEAEAVACLGSELVLPAYDHLLKCSHTFNVLDTRGAVGVAERAALFGRMRNLSRQVAGAYLEQRRSLGFPWVSTATAPRPTQATDDHPRPTRPEPFVLEIGTEELPAGDLASAQEQLRELLHATLKEARLGHQDLRIMGTPRRLVAYVGGLAPAQADLVEVVKGPPAERAFDAQGTPTEAARGFARSKGVPVEALQVRELDSGRYAVAEVKRVGQDASEVLGGLLPGLIASIKFEKTMRWNETDVAFSRPIRWLLALHGEHVVSFEYAGIASGRSTRGLRFQDPEAISVGNPDDYLAALRMQGIVLDPEERKKGIQEQIRKLSSQVGGTVVDDGSLLEEVAGLVECPTGLLGAFAESHLELPRQVAVAVMKKHQRYFPLEKGGQLLPHFIVFGNGLCDDLSAIRAGNEHVLRARFADAAYFVRRDLEQPLETFLPRLASLTFQAKLGSVLDKAHRVERLTAALADLLNLGAQEKRIASRAAHLAKADMASEMVIEMTSLQGEMGREYALRGGEDPEVAAAILEHLLPRYAGDRLPGTRPAIALGLADRLDSLIGLFAVGLQPTGASDPYGLRRSAVGLIQILVVNAIRLDLRRALRLAAEGMPVPVSEGILAECLGFIVARHQALLLGDGHRYDVVDAILAAQGHDPAGSARAVEDLESWTRREDWPRILQAYARCARITRAAPIFASLDSALFVEEAERKLHEGLEVAERAPRATGSVDEFLTALLPLLPLINRFFDDVLVMAEEERLRANRLRLVQQVVDLAEGAADLSKLEGF